MPGRCSGAGCDQRKIVGRVYARMRTGKYPNAKADAGLIAMKRSKIEGELRDLWLTESALKVAAEQHRAEADVHHS